MLRKIFVYGTLKKGFPNHHYLMSKNTGMTEFICNVKTKKKFPLIIDESQGNLPFLLHCEDRGCHVSGELYEIDVKKKEFLDEFEDIGKLYDVVTILVVTPTGHEEECFCYVKHGSIEDSLKLNHMETYLKDHAESYDTHY